MKFNTKLSALFPMVIIGMIIFFLISGCSSLGIKSIPLENLKQNGKDSFFCCVWSGMVVIIICRWLENLGTFRYQVIFKAL
ncbi:MAG: hypothetical protein U9N77_07895 [Thermodesulfobacteriota bacterium]|nr:hypothetical protein [Thermodesulfobacteriota bacterium]